MQPPTGTVTFLFTDIEGSTRRWQDEPEAMRALLVDHDAILRDVVDKHRGHLFKHTGDGAAAAFGSASDAVNAAAEAQRQLVDVLPVRMGLHTGEAEFRDGDYFGATLNRCARLMSIAHGHQIVCSAATAELVRDRDDLRDLGQHRLRDLSRAEHVWQVGGGEFAALRSLENSPTNLPVQPTALVGRQALIAELAALVEREPLVTLTGVGGVGKTRLALAVGAEVLPHFADGVWVVELAPLAHDAMVLQTVAEVLGVAAQTGEPLATTLVSRMKSKRLLMIIDNCEHVLSPVARLVDRLAASAPGVRVLATSREPLGIAAERVRAVPPLAEGTEAVELFIERAAQAGATFDASQRRAIGEICVRLDGIPLAIELAAARARMMAPSQIAERLDQRFRLLTGGGRTAVERHRTLQATVAWSYGLLDDTERAVFQRLSTLAGSFDLDAAQAIATGGIVEGFEVLDALGHLVDKSMVLAVSDSTEVRYRLLETLRQFAADRLADQSDVAEVQDCHATYWCGRARTLGRTTGGTDQNVVLDAIGADIDNYRTAFAHLLSAGGVNDAARGVLALGVYWQIRRTREGLRWHEQLLMNPDLDARRRLRALSAAARAEASTGDVLAGERSATEAVQLADAAGVDAPWGAFEALMVAAIHRQDPVGYRQWWERGHQVVVAGGQRYLQLLVEAQRGSCPGAWDDDELIEHHERLQAEIRRHGDPMLMFLSANTFTAVLHHAGHTERARAIAHSAVDPGRRSGPIGHSAALIDAAAIDVLAGDSDDIRAQATAAEGLRIARDEGLTLSALCGVFTAAALAAQRQDIETAAVLLAAAARHGDPIGIGGGALTHLCRVHAQTAVDAHPRDFTTARDHGVAMTLDDLITYTLDTLT
ncbi:MAG: adenylate/guanylate cyclase domain-containing protein [Acidimicrobiales bacterium]